jgi:hypothetical protein
MKRRTFLKAGAMTTAGLFYTDQLSRQIDAYASLFHRLGRVQWGGFSRPTGAENTIQAIQRMETQIGRKLDVTRHYLHWHGPFPSDAVRWSAAGQRVPFVAWSTDQKTTWKEIIDGREDDHIREKAALIRDWGRHVVFCFEHEPEAQALLGAGTPDEFSAAYDHVHQIFSGVGSSNLKWACVLEGGTYHKGTVDQWMPKTHHILGSDGYNRHPDAWVSFWEIFSPGYHKALSQGKPFIIGEYGCQEDPRKPGWFYGAAKCMKNWKRLRLVTYTNAIANFDGQDVDFRVNSSPDALAAFRDIGHDPYFGGGM